MGTSTKSPLRDIRVLTTLIGVAMAIFMSALENTVIGTAMPTVAAQLGGLEIYSWVFTAYILATTVTTPIWGKLAELFGLRKAMFGGLSLFILGSLLAGASQTMPQLIAFRVVQGLGAAALFPVGMTIVAGLLTLEQRAKVVGMFSGMWGVASLIGPSAGGYLTEYTSLKWRACFLVIIPVGVLSGLLVGVSYAEDHLQRSEISFDYRGTAALLTSLILLLISIERSTQWPLPVTLLSFGVCMGLFYLFGRIEDAHPEPLIPLEIFNNRLVTISIVHGLFAMMALIGTMSFLPLFVQAVIGTRAIEAGNILTPLIISWVLTSVVAARWILRYGYRPLVLAGMASMMIGAFLLATISFDTSRLMLSLYVIPMGIGGGLVILTLMIAAQHSVPRNQIGITTSTVQFARSIGSAVGASAMGAIMNGTLQNHFSHAPGELLPLIAGKDLSSIVRPELREQLTAPAANFLVHSLADALGNTFKYVFLVTLAGTVIAFFVPKGLATDFFHRESVEPGEAEDEEEAEEAPEEVSA
jgi:EmrB/QacA subfamily drug resistance transporter